MSHVLKRSTDSPKPARIQVVRWIVNVALLCGVLSLPIALSAAINSGHLSAQRNADRIADTKASCIRGNQFRAQVRGVGSAGGERIDKILALFIPDDTTNPRLQQAKTQLEQLKKTYDDSVAKVADIDCTTVVTGG